MSVRNGYWVHNLSEENGYLVQNKSVEIGSGPNLVSGKLLLGPKLVRDYWSPIPGPTMVRIFIFLDCGGSRLGVYCIQDFQAEDEGR